MNSAGDGLTTAGVGFNRGLGGNAVDFNVPEPVFGACGAAVLYRRRMLDEIGFLDEDFFLYDEDTDLNFRAQLPVGSVFMFRQRLPIMWPMQRAKRLSDLHVYYHTRNLEFVWMKNMPFGAHASIRAPQGYSGTWIFLLPLPETWEMAAVFSSEARCA